MGNQYHDAEGKFCSKAGMLASVTELRDKGDILGYMKLRSEYDQIAKDPAILSSPDANGNVITLSDYRKEAPSKGTAKQRLAQRDRLMSTPMPELAETIGETATSLDDQTFEALMANPETPIEAMVSHPDLRLRHAAQLAQREDLPYEEAEKLATRSYRRSREAKNEKQDVAGRDSMMDSLIKKDAYSDEQALQLATMGKWRTMENLDAYTLTNRSLTPEFENAVATHIDGGNPHYNPSIRLVTDFGSEEGALVTLAERGYYDTSNPNMTSRVATTILSNPRKALMLSSLVSSLKNNRSLPVEYREALDTDAEKAPTVNFDKAWNERYAALSANTHNNNTNVSYQTARGQLDAQDENWGTVKAEYQEAYRSRQVSGISERAFAPIKQRWQVAYNLRRQAGLIEALNKIED